MNNHRLIQHYRKLLVLVFGLVILVLVACNAAIDDLGSRDVEADDLTFETIDGQVYDVADYDIVILNFWASWCGPCQVEMPELEAYWQKHGGNDILLLAINRGESTEQAQTYVDDNGYTFPVVLDPTEEIYDSYGLYTMPATVLLGPDGTVLQTHNGIVNLMYLEEHISTLRTN